MENEIKSIEEQISDLRAKQLLLEQKNFTNKIVPIINSAMGKTFAYRNNSCGGDRKWDAFRRLVEVAFSEYSAWLLFEQHQITSDGTASLNTEVELVTRGSLVLPFTSRGWEECELSEYSDQRMKALREISNPQIRRNDLEGY